MSQSPAAKPFVNPFSRIKDSSKAGNQIFIEPQAQRFFDTLNGYDQFTVAKGIDNLRSVKYPVDGGRHTWRPMFWRVKKDPGVIGNYLIKYSVLANKVVITGIQLNGSLLGTQQNVSQERNALYKSTRQNKEKFDEKFTPKQNLASLKNSWSKGRAVTSIDTTHAAVNGMLNDYAKATWLMGVHLDYAYKNDQISEYTLFHNPTEMGFPDFYESVRDQLGFTTPNAKHLAAVLQQIQAKGKPVKWVVHSQGGIIFKEAVRYHLNNHGGSLDKNSVIFHAGGNNKTTTNRLLAKVGIKKNTQDNDNPFDLVPQIAGFNDLSCSAIKRCISFWPKVKGSSNQIETESPHTLPFISMEFYKQMLNSAGDTKRAEKIARYMKDRGMV